MCRREAAIITKVARKKKGEPTTMSDNKLEMAMKGMERVQRRRGSGMESEREVKGGRKYMRGKMEWVKKSGGGRKQDMERCKTTEWGGGVVVN
jgi:hypothetical protein